MKSSEKILFNRSKKLVICFIVIFFIFTPIFHIYATPAGAEDATASETGIKKAQEGLLKSANSTTGAGLTTATNIDDVDSTAEVREIIVSIVGYILSFIGVILLINLIFAGYSWMNSGGNEETIKKAKDKITNSIIGLIIILAAYILTSLVFESLNMVIAS